MKRKMFSVFYIIERYNVLILSILFIALFSYILLPSHQEIDWLFTIVVFLMSLVTVISLVYRNIESKASSHRFFAYTKDNQDKYTALPIRATKGSAGYDLAVNESGTIMPGEIKLVGTGVKIKMPETEVAFVVPRSSLPRKKGLVIPNSIGVIDSDYYDNPANDGEVKIQLLNIADQPITYTTGDIFAQVIFVHYHLVDEDHALAERVGGFGSTDKKRGKA